MSNDPKRKDRRSGEDRRKQDLFKEREEFLRKLEEHKKRKQEYADWLANEELPVLPPVEMPVEEEKKKKEATIEIEHATIHIGEFPKKEEEKDEEPEEEPEAEPEPEPEPEEEPEPEPEEEEEEEPKHIVFETPEPDLQPVRMPAVGEFAGSHLEAARDLSSQPLLSLGMPSGMKVDDQPQLPAEAEAATASAGETAATEEETPEIPGLDEPEEAKEEKPQVQEIRGVLELKPPEEDDAPFLTLTYDFTKIPDSFKLSRDYHTMEYAYYKYKPMLVKAQEFTRRKMLKNALNYYRVIKSQNIPPEFKRMINRNIRDITEYLEKFLMSRAG
jgi:hypothetical protein